MSGSITDAELAGFVTETKAILEQIRPRETHLITWDSDVTCHELESAEDLDEITVRGGGGTMYGCVPSTITEQALEPDVVVSFTDGMVMWPEPESVPWPHVTVTTQDDWQAPFGKNIYMDPSQYTERRAA